MIVVTMRYNNGAIGSLEAGSAMRGRNPTPEQRDLNRIYGANGQVVLAARPQIFITEPYQDFSVGRWFEPPVTGWDGRAALEIALAVYRVGELQKPVTLPLD